MGLERLAGGDEVGRVTWGNPQTDLLFGRIQVLRSCLEKLQNLITLRDVGGQLDQGLKQRWGESEEGEGIQTLSPVVLKLRQAPGLHSGIDS